MYHTYTNASSEQREKLIKAILAYRSSGDDSPEREEGSAREHFEWLSWLHRLDPACPLAQTKLDQISARYPQFRQQEPPVNTQKFLER